MLDYSFTKEPAWRAKRLAEWQVFRKGMAEEFNRKELEVYEKYFMDGEETERRAFSWSFTIRQGHLHVT